MMVCSGKRSRMRLPFINDASGVLSTDATAQLRMSLNIWRGGAVATYEVIEFMPLNAIAEHADVMV